MEFTPWGSEDVIKLSIAIIKKYIAAPAYQDKDGQKIELLPDERECGKFMMLCRSRRLNPFEGDAFMVPFWNAKSARHEWALITSHNAYLKRAETHPSFDGFESGVIVENEEGKTIELEGDYVPAKWEGDKVTLTGGWCRVHFKDRKISMYRRNRLSVFQQSFGQWVKNPAGMIVKVAEADALRSAFPTLLGGLYLKEEMDIQAEVQVLPDIRRPQFTKGLPAPDLGSPTKPPVKPPTAVSSASEPAKAPVTPPEASKTPEPPATLVPEPNQGGVAPDDTAELAAMGLAPEFENGTKPEQQPEKQGEKGEFVPNPNESAGLQGVRRLMHDSDVTDAQLLKWAVKNKLAKDGQSLPDLAEQKLASIAKSWAVILPKIQAI